jgi:hypothetical protein
MILFLHAIWDRISAAFGNVGRSVRGALWLMPTVAALSSGCSIHPVQQDVTGLKTHELVRFIRCESRLAIQDKAMALLEHEPEEFPGVDNRALLAAMKDIRGRPWPAGIKAWMNRHERLIYDKYIETGIAYDFSFDITEDNSALGVADPIRLITNGTTGAGFSASGDYKRQNLRHFVVSETAQSLLENVNLKCPPDYRQSSFTYPISGDIGIKELISTFFDLNETKELTVIDKEKPTTVFVDTLTFTTTIMGSVSPHVIVAPVGNTWGLAPPGASITAGAQRIDKHGLIIALSLDKPKVKSDAAAGVVPGYAVGRSALQKITVRSPTEQSALDALGQARLDSYLDRAGR